MFSVKTAFIGLRGKCSRDLIVSLDLLEGKEGRKKKQHSLKVEELKNEDQCFEGYLHPAPPSLKHICLASGFCGVNEP